MLWTLTCDSERRRTYLRETKRGRFCLVLIRGDAGYAWRVLQNEEDRNITLARQLVRFPNQGWDSVEGLAFVAAENVVTPPLEQLAAVGQA